MKDFPRAKEGRERIFPPSLLSPFSPCEGGCTQGNDGDIIMIIVLSILLFFLSIFYVLAYKPIPLLRGSGRIGKITHKALQQDCKKFFGIFKNVKNFSFFL